MLDCPYCGEPLKGDIITPEMSARQKRIYYAVLEAGPSGIKTSDLVLRMYEDEREEPTAGGRIVLRVQINAMNKILKDFNQQIKGRQMKGYRLVRV